MLVVTSAVFLIDICYSVVMNTTNHEQSKQITFNNNPFSLAFAELSKAFKINQNPSIAIIVGGIVIGAVNQIAGYVPDLFRVFIDKNDDAAMLAFGVFSVVFGLGVFVVSILVSTIWSGFITHVGLVNAMEKQTTFKGGLRVSLGKFWSVLGLNIMIGLITLSCLLPAIITVIFGSIMVGLDQDEVGAGLFIASGVLAIVGVVFAIRLGLARTLSLYALLDEDLGIFGSMSRSIALTKGRLIEAWGMTFPGVIVPIVGGLLGVCGMGAHYLQLKVYKDHGVELPKVHILSWLPLMLLGGVLALVVITGLLLTVLSLN